MSSLRIGITWLCLTGALAGLSACSQTSSADAPASSAATTTSVPVVDTPAPVPTDEPTTDPPTTDAPTTVPPTTATAGPTTTMAPNVEVVGPAAAPIAAVGTTNGPDTAVLQDRLTQLGFWSGLSDGKYGFATVQAVMAFQKYIGLPATGKVNDTTAQYLTAFGDKAHGLADSGTLVEVDKLKQLLFIIVDGMTVWTFNTSTGSGIPYEATNKKDPTKIETGDAVTPNGLWKVTRERADGWWDGDLGQIYRPKYFRGGIAIHGMTSVPNYPASHGCVRLSTQAMDFVWDSGLVPVGTPVWVHE
jgi:peptidoglycan hydrolase-like protein with peptidoglycan-binding domain